MYRLSDTQAQEILQMRLQRLTGLEQDKIVAEYKEVMSEIEDLLERADIESRRRGETLSVEEFGRLSNVFHTACTLKTGLPKEY